jgi:hypothetical protein
MSASAWITGSILGLLLLAAAGFLGLAAEIRAAHRECARREDTRLGDDALAVVCRRCDADPVLPCSCTADCGRRYCRHATTAIRWSKNDLAILNGEKELPR